MATLFVDKIDPQSGTSLEIGSSGDTITIPAGATITNNGTQTGFGGVNTPAFSAYLSSIQSISNSTTTTILYNAEQVDTDNCYDTSTGRFTPTTAGKYFVTFSAIGQTGQNSNADFIFGYIKKNTTTVGYTIVDFRANPGRAASITNSAIVSMNGTTDYLLTQIYVTGNFSGSGLQVDVNSNFNAYKIIE